MAPNQEWQLVAYPEGMPEAADFKIVDVPAPEESTLLDGEAIVEVVYMSVDPYMRGRMRPGGGSKYIPSFELNEVMSMGGVAKVTASKSDKFPVGQHYVGMLKTRRQQVVNASSQLTPVDDKMPLQKYLSLVGMVGLSAYFPIEKIGEPKEGETAFVSGAAGAVGSVACQLLKLKGCRVVACAGSDEKVKVLEKLGVDAAFNYKTVGTGPELDEKLKELCPKGIDVYFDNVGGPTLDAAINAMNTGGRVICCGAISQYNNKGAEEGYRLKNTTQLITKCIKMQGFIVSMWQSEWAEGLKALAGLTAAGKLTSNETVLDGFENIPTALIGLFTGANIGKMLVKI